MAPTPILAVGLLALSWALAVASADDVATNASAGWLKANATYYGGADASGTMGGACGYGNLYSAGYGTNTAALSTALFNEGASCGQCYKIVCDHESDPARWKPGATVTVTATNLCPPNWAQSSDNGGWCNPPRTHFEMAQPAWEKIGIYGSGIIIPVLYQRVPCVRQGGVRFTINGFNGFLLVPVSNVGAAGSIQSMDVKNSSSADWMPMNRNWGANWQSLGHRAGETLSFRVTSTDGQTLVFKNIVPSGWSYGSTFTSNLQFK